MRFLQDCSICQACPLLAQFYVSYTFSTSIHFESNSNYQSKVPKIPDCTLYLDLFCILNNNLNNEKYKTYPTVHVSICVIYNLMNLSRDYSRQGLNYAHLWQKESWQRHSRDKLPLQSDYPKILVFPVRQYNRRHSNTNLQ